MRHYGNAVQAVLGRRFLTHIYAEHLRRHRLGHPRRQSYGAPSVARQGYPSCRPRTVAVTDNYPSWDFEIRVGATTIWERWNSIRADGVFGPWR
ncbi:hypothetical protein [Pelomonas puraquae]|uniref:alpha-L-rhamnosidase-related protein n=1 Tax=Roseateles puraquae TaxID=431059 RepID=UPI001184F731